MADENQTCPRRAENGMADPNSPFVGSGTGLDTWTTGHGLVGQEAVGLSCSYCGSLHPDRFMELVAEGWLVGPTDKNYKAYLHRPLTDEERAERKARWLSNFNAEEVRAEAESRGEDPDQTVASLETVYDSQVAPTEASATEAKFYYQHLSVEQRDEFIVLVNEGRMKIGYPGHLYVLPFFATRGDR